MSHIANCVVLVPVSFTMTGFQQKKDSNSLWYSPWFYMHPRGYTMCLWPWVDANGYGVRKNSHILVYLYMMRGNGLPLM